MSSLVPLPDSSSDAMFLVRFLPAVFVFGLAALGYWLTSGGTRLPEMPRESGRWFLSDRAEFYEESTGSVLPDAALVELFRFDRRPHELGSRWTRQSTGTGGPVYQATLQPGDLAIDLTGSVLYHFTPKGLLRRVVVAGTTTRPRECAEYATDVFGFQTEEANDKAAVLRSTGNHKGQLRLTALSGQKDAAGRFRVEWTVEW